MKVIKLKSFEVRENFGLYMDLDSIDDFNAIAKVMKVAYLFDGVYYLIEQDVIYAYKKKDGDVFD